MKVLGLVLAIALGAAGCNDPPPEAPVPPTNLVTAPAIGGGLEDQPVRPGLGPPDHWSETYGSYGPDEFWTEYLVTPPDERFERFGLRLLDFELREQLLLAHQDDLTREEKDAYRRLPSAEACRRFVQARSGTAHVSSQTRR